jgi:hypothetical protein
VCTKRSSTGRFVGHFGSKSNPTILSTTEDLPLDWSPQNTTLGRCIIPYNPISLSLSVRRVVAEASLYSCLLGIIFNAIIAIPTGIGFTGK